MGEERLYQGDVDRIYKWPNMEISMLTTDQLATLAAKIEGTSKDICEVRAEHLLKEHHLRRCPRCHVWKKESCFHGEECDLCRVYEYDRRREE